MSSISPRSLHFIFCTVLFTTVLDAGPGGFAFSTINFTGSNNTIAYGVNNSGQIVGSENASVTLSGFLSSGGTYTSFNAPGAMVGSYAEGINSSGQIVGFIFANAGYLLSGGTFTTITVPGSDTGTTNAIGINDSDQIVGTFVKGGVSYGFLLSAGTYTTISAPGATSTFAWGINNSGQIVGSYTSSGGTFGFLLSGGTYTTISFPGSSSTKAFGLNNSGQIVGEYTSGATVSGFLLQGGNYTAVSVPGSPNTSAKGINDAGQIVGSYVNGAAVLGFSATPNTVAVSFNTYTLPIEGYIGTTPVYFYTEQIAAGPDGALWFSERSAGVPEPNGSRYTIGRITTAGVVTEYATSGLPAQPTGITAGSDGALWFSNGGCFRFAGCIGNIGRITTSGAIAEYPLTGQPRPAGIAAGPDGAMWFTDAGSNQIGRITISGVITAYPLPAGGSAPSGIAAGPDGALWFTESGTDKIGRITTSGTITEYPLLTDGSGSNRIAAGPDGALWFTESSASQIGRITTSGVVTEYVVPTANSSPDELAAGPDGALWFTETSANIIGRITTSGAIAEYLIPTASSAPTGIVAGPDGGVWFTESGASYVAEIVISPNAPPPVLNITKTHTGNFTQGQTKATYTVTVSNQAAAQSTNGLVTVTETLPPGLSLVSMAGTGWTCSTNSCSRGESLPGGTAYPAITVTVNVAANATSPQLNQVGVAGGGSVAASASDSTTIIAIAPLLSVTKTHNGNFNPGQTNATYTVTVSNTGLGATSGTVIVTDTLPSGLTLVSMVGAPPCNATNCSGWTCTVNTCMRSDSLAGGASYPGIIVTVNVGANATSPQVNAVSASGGGSPSANATDSAIIGPPAHPQFFSGEVNVGNGVFYLTFPNNNLFGYYSYLGGSFLYHFDMGYEYFLPANDAAGDIYFYDFQSGHWFYTGPTLFPYLYDFTLNVWLLYLNDQARPGHYTTNPRYFASTATHIVFTM